MSGARELAEHVVDEQRGAVETEALAQTAESAEGRDLEEHGAVGRQRDVHARERQAEDFGGAGGEIDDGGGRLEGLVATPEWIVVSQAPAPATRA